LSFALEANSLRGCAHPKIRIHAAPVALSRRRATVASSAFTLVELLLTVALLLLLLGAVVFSFSNLRRGSSLDEGVNQLEALLRFARAHAASAGCQVQLSFEEEVADGLSAPLGNLRVLWEPDPLNQPGLFEELREAEPYVRGIGDLISIEDVHPLEQNRTAPSSDASAAPGLAGKSVAVSPVATVSEADSSDAFGFAPLTFYPDGSSDSAEIIVTSKDQDDDRTIGLQFVGVTGTFRRRVIPRDVPLDQPAELPAKAVPAEAPASLGTAVPNVAAPRTATNKR